MKYLIKMCLVIVLLQSCANHQTNFQKSFDIETGNEIRPEHPYKIGKSEFKFINKSNENVTIQTSELDTIALAKSTVKFEVTAKDSIKLNGTTIDYEMLGKNKYRWIYLK